MATRWRVLNRRRARKARNTDQPAWVERFEKVSRCDHQWQEEYYGHRCKKCDLFYAHGCAPWDYYGDEPGTDYVAAWLDEPEDYDGDECNGDCWYCGGDGYVDAYEDDPINYFEGEYVRCSSCYGSGRAKDMTIF